MHDVGEIEHEMRKPVSGKRREKSVDAVGTDDEGLPVGKVYEREVRCSMCRVYTHLERS